MELCDVHANLFKNAIKGVEVLDTEHPGHPVRVFKEENLALRAALIRIRRLLDTYELMEDEEILVELGFKPLANPLMRNTVGRKVSLKQGSKLAGTPMDKIVRTLEANGYEVIGLD
ncbi:hemerythrin HHE cation binding domain subfamily [Streptococcus pneumoniae]|nr:hemerythrin HHE cation binding domain subfamily [Streptococcus pneumoniae]